MQNNILDAKNIVKRFGNNIILDHINIKIPRGSIFGLLGPNGAGKTTLMRIINQIIAPDSGDLFFDGKKLEKIHVSDIGYLPEERGLYKKMKVGEQAIYLAKLKGLSHKQATKELKFWFDKFNIIHWWNKKVEELSKGMAQKVQFIVTVIHNPKLLIFDEPFSGFDPINASIIRKEILELRNSGTSIIFSTHRMESVEEICDHISLINNGKCILQGEIAQIKNKFKTNTFSVELKESNLILPEKFKITNQHENKYQIKITDNITSNDLLKELIHKNYIISFKEMIPTMEDIFIRTINHE
tara:strand:- start:55943 stop:56839 length:897 start_codon:yes stop_codon:yes gene_type:complete